MLTEWKFILPRIRVQETFHSNTAFFEMDFSARKLKKKEIKLEKVF